MATLKARVEKLETSFGGADERWLRSLSDAELEAQIAELDRTVIAHLEALGWAGAGHSPAERWAILAEIERQRAEGIEHPDVASFDSAAVQRRLKREFQSLSFGH